MFKNMLIALCVLLFCASVGFADDTKTDGHSQGILRDSWNSTIYLDLVYTGAPFGSRGDGVSGSGFGLELEPFSFPLGIVIGNLYLEKKPFTSWEWTSSVIEYGVSAPIHFNNKDSAITPTITRMEGTSHLDSHDKRYVSGYKYGVIVGHSHQKGRMGIGFTYFEHAIERGFHKSSDGSVWFQTIGWRVWFSF